MKIRFWNLLLILFCCMSVVLSACSHAKEPTTGGTCVPSDQEAQDYIVQHKLLEGGIEEIKKVPIRFVEYGPAYKMVTGRDASGQEKAVWLCRNADDQIVVINSTLLQAGMSEAEVREKFKDKGTIEKLFLAPFDLPPYKADQTIGWYVQLSNPERYLVVDYKTGANLMDNTPKR